MTSGAPWSVKGIDPKAREVAKDLARRSGMTLGEWLNHMILEDESPEDVFSESQLAARPARNYYETPRAPDAGPARYETVEHPGDELTRVVRALDRLTERIETSETHTGLAIGGVEHSVREAVARIEAAERDHVAVAARFEGAVSDVADAQARLADRLRRMESEAAGPRSAEALRSLEQALGKVANHLYDGEGRTRSMIEAVEARVGRIESGDIEASVDPVRLIDAVVEKVGDRLAAAEARTATALEGLQDSFAALDRRLNLVEKGGSLDAGQRFEQLAANLTARVEASRVDIAERLRTASEGRFDRIEKTLSEVAQQVRAAEQGSAQAIERMGREVMTMADTLNQRVGAVEQRSAEAIEQVGGEMARIAEAMEGRLGRADAAHAQALEKLGGEITRITERLAERIGASERRSAQAIDDVIEQVARSNERTSQRHERASDELADRIRQSEERTARLLDEARTKIEQGLANSQRRLEEAADRPGAPLQAFAALAPDPFAELGPAEPDTLSAQAPKPAPDAFSAYAAFAAPPASGEFVPAPDFKAFEGDQAFPSAAPAPAFDAEDFAAADEFAPLEEMAEEAFASAPAGQAEPEPELDAEAESEPDSGAAEQPLTLDAEPLPEVEALNSALDILEAVKARQAQAAEPEPPEQTIPVFQHVAGETNAPAATATQFELPAPPAWTLDQEEPEIPSEEAWRAAIQDSGPAGADPLSALEAMESAADRESFEITTPAGQADAGPAPDQARPLTTREVVEQARAAARAAAQNGDGKRSKLKVEKAPHEGGLFSGFGLRPKRRAGSKLQVALMLTGGAAALGVATAGFVLDGKPDGAPPQRVADALSLERGATAPQAAVALAPAPIGETLTSTPTDGGQNLAGLYAEALKGVEAGESGAAEVLRKVASLGYPRAQFHLAKLYEAGEGGLKKDLSEARRWTERAARGGDREAMHNFALQQFFGDGGAKDAMGAAEWFRRAAELGLVDSQFNLARLYEDGVGVTRNFAEAYKWYLIAAKSGDPDSKASAARVRAQLSADARSVTERAAASFRSALPGALGAAAQPAGGGEDQASVVTAQQALSRLGYYQGPSDGVPSPALRMAIAAYQRDQGLEADGGLDATTVSRLSVFTR